MDRIAPREALFQSPEDGGRVTCHLCAHHCTIEPGKRGICKVRENRDGVLYSLTWGMLASLASDPIEKKPLFHFLPGSSSLSVATVGCNMRCGWCQNHSLSRVGGEAPTIRGRPTEPHLLVDRAEEAGCASISFTYSEPTIYYEYARDIGVESRRRGLRNVFVSNGHMTPEVVEDAAASFLDAANIDLKGGTPEFYRHHCKASMQAVTDSITLMHERGIWVEVTTLVIPGYNDSPEHLEAVVEFIAQLDPAIPWHVSRFRPDLDFRDVPPTPIETLDRAVETGRRAGLHHIYVGNAWGNGREDTTCPGCGSTLIERRGFTSRSVGLEGDHCRRCSRVLEGVIT